jgi:hypothetical protein
MKIENDFPSTTATALTELEGRLGFELPEPYRRFLLRTNGGQPTPDRLFVPGWHGKSTCLAWFYGVQGGPHYDLAANAERMAEWLPDGFVPIGEDSGGNCVCLATKAPHSGRVYFWDHESRMQEDGTPKRTVESLFEIAPSFEALLASLVS